VRVLAPGSTRRAGGNAAAGRTNSIPLAAELGDQQADQRQKEDDEIEIEPGHSLGPGL
jgi:hypothetical protein